MERDRLGVWGLGFKSEGSPFRGQEFRSQGIECLGFQDLGPGYES